MGTEVIREKTVEEAVPFVRQIIESQLQRISGAGGDSVPIDDVAKEIAAACMGHLLASENITAGRDGVDAGVMEAVRNAKYLQDSLPGLPPNEALNAVFRVQDARDSIARDVHYRREAERRLRADVNRNEAETAKAHAQAEQAKAYTWRPSQPVTESEDKPATKAS